MSTAEADRLDLYTRLVELLGSRRADTLMANLPTVDPADVATKSDIGLLRSDFELLRSDFGSLRSDFESLRSDMRSGFESLRSDMRSDFKVVHERIDRLFITLVTGLFVIVAAMAGVFAATVV